MKVIYVQINYFLHSTWVQHRFVPEYFGARSTSHEVYLMIRSVGS